MTNLGFFQLYMANRTSPVYPSNYRTAGASDKIFGGQFRRENRHRLVTYVHHLGDTGRWRGNHKKADWLTAPLNESCPGRGEMGAGGGEGDWRRATAALARLGVTGPAAATISRWAETDPQLFTKLMAGPASYYAGENARRDTHFVRS